VEFGGRESMLSFPQYHGKGGAMWFPSNHQWVGTGMGGSQARWGWSLSQSVVNLEYNIKFLWVLNFP
jgi:hypothetical protein